MVSLKSTVTTVDGLQVALISMNGDLDNAGSPVLETAIDEIHGHGVYDIVVDLSQVSFVSSAGWAVFVKRLNVMAKHRGHFRFVGMRPDVQDIFRLVGLDMITGNHTYVRVQDALEAIQAGAHSSTNNSTFDDW